VATPGVVKTHERSFNAMNTRRERLERKLEKRKEWAEKAGARADGRFGSARRATNGIPFGQPILVGHHSEKRHRNALKRSDQNMRKGIEEQDKAEHHNSKAHGLEIQLENTVFSDDPDAIEQLEAKIEKAEQQQERMKAVNSIVRSKPKNELTEEKITKLVRLGQSEVAARAVFEPDFAGRIGIPSYALQNNNANIRRMKERVKDITHRQKKTAAAENSPNGVTVERRTEHNWAIVTFAEKPERDILNTLRNAGYRWSSGSWHGYIDKLPSSVQELEGGA